MTPLIALLCTILLSLLIGRIAAVLAARDQEHHEAKAREDQAR